MRFVDTTDGSEVPENEVLARVTEAVRELRERLAEARKFRANLRAGTLKEGDLFLDFSGPLEHGYDRTGPSEVTATEEV